VVSVSWRVLGILRVLGRRCWVDWAPFRWRGVVSVRVLGRTGVVNKRAVKRRIGKIFLGLGTGLI